MCNVPISMILSHSEFQPGCSVLEITGGISGQGLEISATTYMHFIKGLFY